MKGRTRTPQPAPAAVASPAIHTPLSVDDRDALDPLMRRIKWQALLVQRTLATWDNDDDLMYDDDRTALEVGLIELCASIVRDTEAMHQVMERAEQRGADDPKPI